MNPYPLPIARRLAAVAVVAVVAVLALHYWASGQHASEAREHHEMIAVAMAPQEADLMRQEAATEGALARLLVCSAICGAVLALWGAVLLVRRSSPAALTAWAVVTGLIHLAMLTAGIASRTLTGLLGHVDKVTTPWAGAVTLELLVVVVSVAIIAARLAASQIAHKTTSGVHGQVRQLA